MRLKNTDDLSVYLSTYGASGQEREEINKEEGAEEFVMLGLRTEEGVDLAVFRQIFGIDFMKAYGKKVEKLQKMLRISPDRVAITPEFFYVSNTIIEELIY